MAETDRARKARKPAPKAKQRTAAQSGGRKVAWSIGAVALAAGAGLLAFLSRGRIAERLGGDGRAAADEGHVPTDLLDPNRNADDRAVADFRPDMSAPMTASDRAALAPATGPSPSLVADRGGMNGQTTPAA